MTGLPTIHAEGTLIGDPELRFNPKGKPIAKWRIACNERRFNRTTQEWETARTTFITGSCWNDLAENVCETLRKGDRVMVAGKLTMREWETDDGKRATAFEIAADTMGPSLMFTTARLQRDRPAPTEHTTHTVNTTAPTVNTTMVDPFGATEPSEEAPF